LVHALWGIQIPGLKAAILRIIRDRQRIPGNESPSKPFQGLIEGKVKVRVGRVKENRRECRADNFRTLDTPEFHGCVGEVGKIPFREGRKIHAFEQRAQIKRLNSLAIHRYSHDRKKYPKWMDWTFELDGKNVIPIPSSQSDPR